MHSIIHCLKNMPEIQTNTNYSSWNQDQTKSVEADKTVPWNYVYWDNSMEWAKFCTESGSAKSSSLVATLANCRWSQIGLWEDYMAFILMWREEKRTSDTCTRGKSRISASPLYNLYFKQSQNISVKKRSFFFESRHESSDKQQLILCTSKETIRFASWIPFCGWIELGIISLTK